MSRELVEQAAQRMRQHKYSEAIELLDAHLREDSDDLVAMMRLGICHLLNRSERVFVSIHGQVAQRLQALAEVPAEVGRLWGTYNRLMRNLAATALVVGATAGCAEPAEEKVEIEEATRTEQAIPEVDAGEAPDEAMSMHRYSGGVYLGDDIAPAPPAVPTPTPPPAPDVLPSTEDKEATSMHRYSGGVYLNPHEAPKD